MDLTGMIQNPVEDQSSEQKLSKEEYAALKKQEREETWMQIDGQAQSVFKDGASLQKFLDFMAGQYNMPKVPNLLLLYSQNPEVKLVKSFDEWKHDRRSLRTGVHGYRHGVRFIVVLIAMCIVFKQQITSLVNNIWNSINKNAKKIY